MANGINPVHIARWLQVHQPDNYREITNALKSTQIPSKEQVDFLKSTSRLHSSDEYKLYFIITFAIIYDKKSVELNINLRHGMRKIIAGALGEKHFNAISAQFQVAKTRYQCIPEFRRKTDFIVNEYIKKYTNTLKVK